LHALACNTNFLTNIASTQLTTSVQSSKFIPDRLGIIVIAYENSLPNFFSGKMTKL
jgi:hypothetical protein